MNAVVTDKFKGTLTGREIADIICEFVPGSIYIPMADGGEGTAEALGATLQGDFYTFTDTDGTTAAYVPSCGEGISSFPNQDCLPLRLRSSAPVGRMVATALRSYNRVYVGIGGTRTADGGVGFAEEVRGCAGRIIGLADVSAPLVSEEGISAMSFLVQKGATEADMEDLRVRFNALKNSYPSADRFGGSGGGIGFAIESILKGKVIPGAPYILRRNLSQLTGKNKPELLITGEGCVDEQTSAGKVVDAVYTFGKEHNIPVVIFAGKIEGNPCYEHVFSAPWSSDRLPTRDEAVANLRRSIQEALPIIKILTR